MLVVGSASTVIRVEKHLLAQYEYFSEHMKAPDAWDLDDGVCLMPKEDPADLVVLLNWLVYGEIMYILPEEPFADMTTKLQILLNAYSFVSHKIFSGQLLDVIMSRIVESHRDCDITLSPNKIIDIYRKTIAGSRMRQFAIRMLHWQLTTIYVDRQHTKFSPAQYQELLVANEGLCRSLISCMTGSNGQVIDDPRRMPLCMYHVHSKFEPCPTGHDIIMVPPNIGMSP